jgi:acylphosphatase
MDRLPEGGAGVYNEGMKTMRAHIHVSGLVQGVFFRATTVETAHRIGAIGGWAKNLPDGRVEVVAEGPEENVDALIRWLRRGPPSAKVTAMEVADETPTGEFSDFTVAY